MKRILLSAFVFCNLLAQGQINLRIYNQTGGVDEIPISQIDSVTFSNQNQNIHTTGGGIFESSINGIDSINFKNTPVLISGMVDVPSAMFPIIEVSSELENTLTDLNGNFSIEIHSILMAENKTHEKAVYFGYPVIEELNNYVLNAKETALYFALGALPSIRRPFYKNFVKRFKEALYTLQEVQDLEQLIASSVSQFGYLDYNLIGPQVGVVVDKVLQEIDAPNAAGIFMMVNYNSTYAAGGGFYRVSDKVPAGWTDTYDANTNIYKLKRKFFNNTAAVVGVQIGNYDFNNQTAALSGNYIGFIEPYYPPNLLTVDGTLQNFKQVWQTTLDVVNNGWSGLANTDAYSKDNEFIFEAREGDKDAFIFVNGFFDPDVMKAMNVIYLFMDNFQDIYEDLSGNNFYSENDFINDFFSFLVSDYQFSLANYIVWFENKNYDLIIDDLASKLESYVDVSPLSQDAIIYSKFKNIIDKKLSLLAGGWSTIYKYSALAYKISTTAIISNSPKFSRAIPIEFAALPALPPYAKNPNPFSITLNNVSSVNFQWTVDNPNNQTLTYEVFLSESQFGLDNNRIANNISATNFNYNGLNQNTRYYWRVDVKNSDGLKSKGAIWTFNNGTPSPVLPVLFTSNTSNITSNSAVSGGHILDDGGATVTARGVCWSTAPNPTIANDTTNNGSGTGVFTSNITGLNPNTTYYVRTYAVNSIGVAYGGEISFQTPSLAGTISALNCNSATNNGTLTQGTAASGVSSVVPYTGGNGGTHNGQTVNSTGVTGLTAMLSAGSFANGAGSLTYTITGTPTSSGTANFALNIGGQICTLSRTVNAGSGIVSNPGAGVTFNGYTYPTIILGNGQEWMAENLRTTTYRNGDPIPNVTDPNLWFNLTTGAWAHYNNDPQYENPYGKLYNWFAVNDSRNICPAGWHVPTDAEWTILTDYLGGSSFAGGKMKSTGTQYWQSPNADATNESGFSGLPGGLRADAYDYYFIGSAGYWWSSTQILTDYAWGRHLGYNSNIVSTSNYFKTWGFSVRCLRD